MNSIGLSIGLTLVLLLLAASPLMERATAAPPSYDLLIKNGLVIDGTGAPGFRADVVIKNDRIALVGHLPRGAQARRVIDASGLVVAPGFIDMLGQSDHYVLIAIRAMCKLIMIVTTVIEGQIVDTAEMHNDCFNI